MLQIAAAGAMTSRNQLNTDGTGIDTRLTRK
jgi:hypothetical protein